MKRDLMKAAAKFTVTCNRCGRKVCKDVTQHTAAKSMAGHERSHHADDGASTPT